MESLERSNIFLRKVTTGAFKQTSNYEKLSLKINKCLNKGGYKRSDLYHAKKLMRETVGEMEIGEKNMVKQ